MRRPWLVGSLVVVLTAVAAYGTSTGGGWVFDDHRFVEQNPALDTVDVPAYFRDPETASASEGIHPDIYRPIRTFDYAVDTAVFGRDDAPPFRWENLLLHALAAILVFRLAWRVAGERVDAGLLAGLLFAVHPVAVEAVAWVSSRGDLLALVGMLAALLVLERPGVGRTLLGALLALLACFAKESAVVLPALLLLRDVALPPGRRLPWRTTVARTAVLLFVALGYIAVRLTVIGDLAQGAFPGGSRAAAGRGMLGGLWWYAKDLLWPSRFAFDVHLRIPGRWSDPSVVLGIGLLATLLLAGWWGMRRRNALALATWGALACLVPASNVLVPLKALVADRFLYPVLFCAAVGVAWGLSRWKGIPRLVGGLLVAAIVVALLPVTRSRAEAWRSDLSLWETVLRERPGHMRAYEGLAYEYLRAGRIRDAEIAYRSYLAYNPADAKSMVLLADALGSVADALRQTGPPGQVIVGGEGRREARVAQLRLYRLALDTWARIGLVRGRGSPELLRHVQRARVKAAVDLGDVVEAKRANDDLLRLDGVDPDDPDAVLASAPYERRKTRLNLALQVLVQKPPRDLSQAMRKMYLSKRATILRDVEIAPSRTDAEALARLLPVYRKLTGEPQAGPEETANLALLLEELGDGKEAAEVRRRAMARWPDSPLFRSGT